MNIIKTALLASLLVPGLNAFGMQLDGFETHLAGTGAAAAAGAAALGYAVYKVPTARIPLAVAATAAGAFGAGKLYASEDARETAGFYALPFATGMAGIAGTLGLGYMLKNVPAMRYPTLFAAIAATMFAAGVKVQNAYCTV